MSRQTITPLRPRHYLLYLLGLLFLWPAVLNGGAFFFNDTTAYIRGIDAAVYKLTAVPSDWTAELVAETRASPATAGATPRPAAATPVRPVLLGRSAYYGAILYLGVVLGSFWPFLLLQAMLGAACLIGLVRHFVDPGEERRFRGAVIAVFAVCLLTPAPFFVCLLMPDIFSGLAIAAAAMVLCGWERETRAGRIGLVALLAFAALVHSSNILLLGGLGALAALLRLRSVTRSNALPMLASSLVVLATALVGVGGDALFAGVVTHVTGTPPIRPPFLTARMIDDGPGTQYLRSHCARSTLLLCRFTARLPSPSDSFLWEKTTTNGVFMTLPPDEQRTLAAEQGRFVAAAALGAPAETAGMLARNFAKQVASVRLSEFNYDAGEDEFFVRKVPANTLAGLRRTAAFKGQAPTAAITLTTLLLTAASLAVLLGTWSRRSGLRQWSGYATVAVAGVLVNDVICGCLSTPHDRYQMRVIWVLPAVAALVLVAKYRNRTAGAAGGLVPPAA